MNYVVIILTIALTLLAGVSWMIQQAWPVILGICMLPSLIQSLPWGLLDQPTPVPEEKAPGIGFLANVEQEHDDMDD